MIASPIPRTTGPARMALALLALAACLALSPVAAGPAAAQQDTGGANAPAAPGGEAAPGKSPGDAADNLGKNGGGGGTGGGGGGGAGWSPIISALQSLVPIAGAIGLLIGLGIWGSAGANSAQKQVGLGVMGTACLGLVIGSFAADLAAMFTQWI